MSLRRVAPRSQAGRNRMFNSATGRFDGETVVHRDLACIRARRKGRLDAASEWTPAYEGGDGARGLMLHEEYLRAYEQERRRMAHAKRVRAACTPAGRTQALIREHREILGVLAAELELVCPEAAADTRRAASALFAAWFKLKGK